MISPLDVRVGWYLAVRQIRRASLWTNGLIVFVMLLTFLNLVAVSGVLVGLVEGISNLYRQQETGDVVITSLDSKNYIENSDRVIAFIHSLPQVAVVNPRYIAGGTAEANYKTHTDPNERPNKTGATIVGIEPSLEDSFSQVSKYVGEGAYLTDDDFDTVLLGSQLVDRYAFGKTPGLTPLEGVRPGSHIRITVNGSTREVVVKGIVVTTANSPLAARIFMPAREVRALMGRDSYDVDQISIRLKKGVDPTMFRDLLVRSGIANVAKVQSFEDAIPNGVSEIKNTFAQIGNAIGSIGLVVASITIFIVIFINAVTRRKFIGILKGIGVSPEAIEVAYMLQSLFYAFIGSGIGLLIIYGFLVPYTAAHPIVLPISNAIMVAPITGTSIKIALLVTATVIAGFIPARMIVRKNTLDSILGRN